MTCRQVMRYLSVFLDRELDAALTQELLEHLKKCEDCRLIVDTTRKTIELYCNSEPLDLPVAVRERLHQALARKPASPPS